MSLTVNTKSYVADNVGPNAVIYSGPSHTLSVLDDIALRRSAPKPTKDFSGVSKTSAKLSRTLPLSGTLTPSGVSILEISVSVPVGAAPADVDAVLNDMGSFLSSAAFKDHVKKTQINF